MATITITNVGVGLYRDSVKNAANPLISYVALGTDSTTPGAGDTALHAEAFRKKVTSYTNGTNPGEILVDVYIAPGDAVGLNIAEVGFFGGATASALPNSGVLVGRGLYSHPGKTNVESIQGQFDLNFTPA